MKGLGEKDIQEGRIVHGKNGGESVKVIKREISETGQIVVVYTPLLNHENNRKLPILYFCKQYQRKKR